MTVSNADLRKFILSAFSDDDFEVFCFDYFPAVANNFATGMARNKKVMLLINHCRQTGRLDDLLANLKREREATFPRSLERVEPVAVAPQQPRVRNPRQVFISHAHQDGTLARRLADDLEAEGYAVWIAPDSIRPGEKWAEAIERGLETSGLFVLLLTPNAVASRWVKTETNVAIELEHEGALRFVPVMVKACKLPMLWRAYQRVSWRGGYDVGYGRLLAALVGDTAVATLDNRSPERPVPEKTTQAQGRGTKPVKEDSDVWINPIDGKEFVRVPAGEFLAGDDKQPMHLDEFWISKTPVTNADYKRFIDANPKYDVPFVNKEWARSYNWNQSKRTYPANKADHPVVLVSWHDAQAYAEWAEVELPTEWQWEKAARGTDGREYPWGDEKPSRDLCNFGGNEGGTTPIGNYSPQGDSPYGCVDMAGNVWEWTASLTKEGGSLRALRGGSWLYRQLYARASARLNNLPNSRFSSGGFRVVRVVAHLNDR